MLKTCSQCRFFILLGVLLPFILIFILLTSENKSPPINDRFKKSLFTTGAGLLNQIVLVAIQLLSVPLILKYLGSEKFGLLGVMTTYFFFWGSTDLGLGFGLQNAVPAYRNKPDRMKRAHAGVFFAMAGIGTFLFLSAFVWLFGCNGVAHLPFRGVISDSDYVYSLLVLFFCFCFNMPLLVASNVLIGLQKGYIPKITAAAANLIGIVCLFIGIYFHRNIVFIVAASNLPGILSSVLNYIYFYKANETKHLTISFRFFDAPELKKLLKIGLVFWILGLTSQLMFGWDNIPVAKFLGLEAVAKYSIAARITRIFALSATLFFAPLLPAYNDAFHNKDTQWLRKTTVKNFQWLVLASVLFLPIVYFGTNTLVYYWLGYKNYFDSDWLLLMYVLIVFLSFNAFVSYIMLSAPLIKKMLWVFPPAALLSLAGKWYGVQYFGVTGLVFGGVIPYVFIFFGGSGFYIRKILWDD